MWVVGYYENLNIRIPGEPDVTITNATLLPQDTSFFNVTILNPSYSPSEANITRIATSTKDGLIHNITTTFPPLPYTLPKATRDFSGSETFTCLWNWANYTGETVGIIAFLADGSGPTTEVEAPLVDLRITEVSFDSSISVTHFNVTVQNFASSTTHNITIDITEISVTAEGGIKLNITEITPQLPWPLNPADSRNFTCTLDWTEYQNARVTVAVYTSQGYMDYTTVKLPLPVILEITDVLFDVTNTSRFDITVKNDNVSPTYLNVTEIGVIIGNQTVRRWTMENGTAVNPPIPFTLNRGSTETFVCPWNWTDYRDEEVTVVIDTLQGFTANYSQPTPPPVNLNITNLTFDPINTEQVNFTVLNSEFSLTDTEITEVLVTIEDDIVANLTGNLDLPMPLSRTHSIDFTGPWNWGIHLGENATVVVETKQGYSFNSDPITLVALRITGVTFNPTAADYFSITIQNPTLLNFTLTKMRVTVDGPSQDVTDDLVPPFPFPLPTGADYTFICYWEEWIYKQEQEVTITVETLNGYEAEYTGEIPSVPS
jgi:hypothetical protein